MKSKLFFVFFALMLVVQAEADPKRRLTNMVYVPARPPLQGFYIDIFEAQAKLVEQAIGNGGIGGSINWKPARISAEQARQYCEKVGKRLPTVGEWYEAASNMGQNKNSTLKGDPVPGRSGFVVNMAGPQSLDVTAYSKLGIDAIGTVGMTGNRFEWVTNPTDPSVPYVQCGRQYEDREFSLGALSHLCEMNPARFAGSATTRCVVDPNGKQVLHLGPEVTGELLTYVQSLGRQTGAPTPNVPAVPVPTNPAGPADKFIPSNPYTQGGGNVQPPPSNYDDEF